MFLWDRNVKSSNQHSPNARHPFPILSPPPLLYQPFIPGKSIYLLILVSESLHILFPRSRFASLQSLPWEFLFILQGPSQMSPPLGGLPWYACFSSSSFQYLAIPSVTTFHIYYLCLLVYLHSLNCLRVLSISHLYFQSRKVPVYM